MDAKAQNRAPIILSVRGSIIVAEVERGAATVSCVNDELIFDD
jgi:hypothetical protein